MPAIKNIATLKKKSGNALFATPRKEPDPVMPWRKKSSGRGVKAKSGRVKKVTKLTAEFVAAADKKVRISSKPKY